MRPTQTTLPFWNRLPEIARYPFRGAALISLIVFSLGSLLGLLPGIGWILRIVIWLATYRYAFEILLRTAHGRMDAPEITAHADANVAWYFLGLWVVYFLIFLAAGLIAGPIGAILAMLVLTLLLPGAIISLAIDGVLGHAINPSTAFGIMSRIGAPYFAAFGLLFVIQTSAGTAEYWLSQHVPLLSRPLATAAAVWGIFAAFHLMGYLIFQYHEALGFEPGDGFGKPRLRNRDTDLLDEAQALVADGQTDAAIARLAEDMRERAVPIEAHELYRKLLRAKGDGDALLAHAPPYLNLLLLERQDRRALGLARESLDANRDFTAHQPEDGHRLAQRARDSGQAQLAIDLWLAMIKRWPRDPARAEWALDAAALLAQRDRLTQARQLLQHAAHGLDEAPRRRLEDALARLPAA